MRIAYLDICKKDIAHFLNICESIPCIKNIECFFECNSLLNYIKTNYVDIVFTEIDLGTVNGLSFINEIRNIIPNVATVFVTSNPEYAINAFEVGAQGYILKPCSLEKIMVPINQISNNFPEIEIRTFGNFDLFVNNSVVFFPNKKSKEILALLVDRCGGSLNMEQIIDVLWEDRPFDNNTKVLYRIALKGLRDTLKATNCLHIIKETRGQRSLDTTKVKCDYYEYLKNPENHSGFHGEYMTNYSWGEYTLAKISQNQT